MIEKFYSRNGWDLMGTTVDKEAGTITYHTRKGLRTKDITQRLGYVVKFNNLFGWYFKD